ncbi:MAG: putative transport system substrate-binding protein [Bradyrhizobium sp.]|nr:putative transport system substrate-binding protein [Bradyrhizobium sp.]
MKRREFIALVGGAAVSLPFAARAQAPAMPVIGFLHSASRDMFARPLAAFHQGLGEAGYVEGRNVSIEYRWAENQYDRLPAMAADLVSRGVNVIATPGSTPAALAAKAGTSEIPLVFLIGNDPVKLGLVASLNAPGGKVTGVSFLINALEAKKLEVMHQLVPAAATIGVLLNPKNPLVDTQLKDTQEAAAALDIKVIPLNAGSEADIEAAFATLVEQRAGALLVTADPALTSWRDRMIALAARHAIPTIYHLREFTAAGGLISYGTSLSDGYRQVGIYVGRILKGTKPADLPVQQPTKFEMVINMKTAKALRLDVPARLLATADEVIE